MANLFHETIKQIADLYETAVELALGCVEAEARRLLKLKKFDHLEEFVMAMGDAFFTKKNDSKVCIQLEQYTDFARLNEFIEDWDRVLKLTVNPMRFTADGPKITDW